MLGIVWIVGCSSATTLKVIALLCTISMALYPKIKKSKFLVMALVSNSQFSTFGVRLGIMGGLSISWKGNGLL